MEPTLSLKQLKSVKSSSHHSQMNDLAAAILCLLRNSWESSELGQTKERGSYPVLQLRLLEERPGFDPQVEEGTYSVPANHIL